MYLTVPKLRFRPAYVGILKQLVPGSHLCDEDEGSCQVRSCRAFCLT